MRTPEILIQINVDFETIHGMAIYANKFLYVDFRSSAGHARFRSRYMIWEFSEGDVVQVKIFSMLYVRYIAAFETFGTGDLEKIPPCPVCQYEGCPLGSENDCNIAQKGFFVKNIALGKLFYFLI